MKQLNKNERMTDLILETFRLNGALLTAGNQLTKPFGLTSARWQVMGAIDLAGQALTVAQIARRMGLARQGVQRIVNDLERLGMVTFKSNIDHKRASLIAITTEGNEVMLEVGKAQLEWVSQLAVGQSEAQIEQGTELLRTTRERIENISSDPKGET